MAQFEAQNATTLTASIRRRLVYYLPTIAIAVGVILLWEFVVLIFISSNSSCPSPPPSSPNSCCKSTCGWRRTNAPSL